MGQYPVEWEADVVLRDGSTTHLRPIRPEDADALQRFHVGQSERSIYLRFFAVMERLSDRDLQRFTHVDYVDRAALVAVRPRQADEAAPEGADADAEEDIIGVARYDRTGPTEAEVAFNIADAAQGRGLGSVLLEHIAAAARERGIHRFVAEVLPQNGKMLAVFREAGFALRQHVEDGVITVALELDPTARSRAVMADREHRAEARSMESLLKAAGVVVLGPWGKGTDRPVDFLLAERVLGNLTRAPGIRVAVVGGPADVPPGVERYESIKKVPGPVDLAVLALPPEAAIAAVRKLARLQVRGLVVLSAGYGERGPEGVAKQRELVRAARAEGMRVIGPASYGLIGGDGERRLAATLAPELPHVDGIGLFCQSAPMAVPMIGSIIGRGLGVSSFLSSGHRADVSGNDMMQYWQDDSSTRVACLYLESIGNPRKFTRIARRLASSKPVVVVTVGTSHVVPPGHAVRASRVPRGVLSEILRQSGVIRAANVHHLADIALLLAHQPLPAGPRVGVLASSAALAALVAEAASTAGMVVSASDFLPEDADDERTRTAVEALYAGNACDMVVLAQLPVVSRRNAKLLALVAAEAARTGRTTVANVIGLRGLTDELCTTMPPRAGEEDGEPRRCYVPAFTTADDAVAALGSVMRYARWRASDRGTLVQPAGIEAAKARTLVEGLLEAAPDGVDLDPDQLAELLGYYGIRLWPAREVRTPDEAVAAANELGWPVALKSTATSMRHRPDLGGVRLGIANEAELRADFEAMRRTLAAVPDAAQAPLEVQPMASTGVAVVIRSMEDHLYGPLLSFALAGDAERLGDVSYRVPPVTDEDISAMVRSVKAAPMLFGYQGAPDVDIKALEDLLARVAVMADDTPELRRLELYPVVVGEHGLAVLTAVARVEDTQRADAERRVLPD